MNNIEQIAREVAEWAAKRLLCREPELVDQTHKTAYDAALEMAARLGDGWISVETRLPEFNKTILFYVPSDNMNLFRIGAFYQHTHRFISDDDKYYKSDVTHWMPLPEPPKESDHG